MLGMQQITIYAIAAVLITLGMIAWLLDAALSSLITAQTQQQRPAWRGFVIFILTIASGIGLAVWGDSHAMKVAQDLERTQLELQAQQQAIQKVWQEEMQRYQRELQKLFAPPGQ